jgi:hypothetical protein
VTLNFTGVSAYNFIFPYTHAATLGIAFFLLYIEFIIIYLFGERKSAYFIFAVIFGLLAAWSKIEFTFAVILTLTAVVFIYKVHLRYFLSFLITASASIAGIAIFFHDSGPSHHWIWDNIFSSSIFSGMAAPIFYAQVSGFDEPWQRVSEIFFGTLLISALIGLLALIDRLTSQLPCRASWRGITTLSLLMAALLFFSWHVADVLFFSAWSLLQVLLLPVALLEGRNSPLLLLLLFSLSTSIRIFLNLSPFWYGFFLIIPTYLLIVYVLFEYLPRRRVYSAQAALLWIPIFLLIMIRGQIGQGRYYATKIYPITTARGSFYDSSKERASILQDLLDYLGNSNVSSLVVIPEGLTLNYFSGIPNPLSFHTFTPVETASAKTEQQIIEELEKFRPELVILNNRDVREFGYQGFGVDYNQNVMVYLQKHYNLERSWNSSTFRLILLKRTRKPS